MSDIEYNLIDEPWIRVMTPESDVNEINLMDVLINAQTYRGLAGELAAQDMAMLRFLAALVHTVITRMDIDGNASSVKDEKEGINRWIEIWENGKFPETSLKKYLSEWKDRFWLFHPTRPFYQVPQAEIGTKNGVNKLNGAVSESNNKLRLFSQISGSTKDRMSYSESARWLLFLNGFDDCAAKQADKSDGSRGSTVGWLGKLGLIYSVGNNLFETIMLNMPMVMGVDKNLWDADVPTWEPDIARSRERETIDMPTNLAGLYTLQSRRILLKKDDGYVTGYSILGGDVFEDRNALNEPMTLWQIREENKQFFYKPLLHHRSRYIWRDFAVLAIDRDSVIRPGIVEWCELIRKEHIFPKNYVLTFGIVCIRYDSSQSSSITDGFADDVLFHVGLLSEAGRYWRNEIENQIEKIEKAAEYVKYFTKDLRRADGLDPKFDNEAAEGVSEEFFHDIDACFREWLLKLDSDQDNEERNNLIIELENDVRSCIWMIGRNLFEQAGDSAFIGRVVEKGKAKQHYSSPEAYRWFKRNIWKLYPLAKGDDAIAE